MVSVICAIYVTFEIFIGNSGYLCTRSPYGPGSQVAGGWLCCRQGTRKVSDTDGVGALTKA